MRNNPSTKRRPYKRQAERWIRQEPYENWNSFILLTGNEDYLHSKVTPQHCVWEGTCETCPSSYLCES